MLESATGAGVRESHGISGTSQRLRVDVVLNWDVKLCTLA